MQKYFKSTVMFDAPTKSGKWRTMTGIHWPVHVLSDAAARHRPLPVISGQKCRPLPDATVHQQCDAAQILVLQVSDSLLTHLCFKGKYSGRMPSCCWTPGQHQLCLNGGGRFLRLISQPYFCNTVTGGWQNKHYPWYY